MGIKYGGGVGQSPSLRNYPQEKGDPGQAGPLPGAGVRGWAVEITAGPTPAGHGASPGEPLGTEWRG